MNSAVEGRPISSASYSSRSLARSTSIEGWEGRFFQNRCICRAWAMGSNRCG